MPPDQVAPSLSPFDTLLTFGATLALVLAICWYSDGELTTLDIAVATGLALVAAGSGAFLSRSSRCIFLTPLLRIVLIMAFGGASGVLFGGRPRAEVRDPTEHARLDELVSENQKLLERAGNLEGRLKAKAGETEDLRAALRAAGKEREAALAEANAKYTAEHALRLRQQEQEQNGKGLSQPDAPATAPKPDKTAPSEDDILANGLRIPRVQVTETRSRLEGSPLGRNLIAYILSGSPLYGEAIVKLFGGGGKTRQTITTVVTLMEAGTIPPSADLEELFATTPDTAALRSDLHALADRVEKQGVLSPKDAKEVKDRIDEIAAAAATPLPPEALSAQTEIRNALRAGTPCSLDITRPWFVAFDTVTQKRIALRRTEDEATRNCLKNKYPPLDNGPQ